MAILVIQPLQLALAQDDPRLERAGDLERLAVSLEEVQVDLAKPEVDLQSEDRQVRQSSELHFRFLISLTALENDDRDALLLIPIEISGFTFELDTRESLQAQRVTGQDLQKARVSITNFFEVGEAQASIEIPEFNHGSQYNAERLVRDEIQRLLEWWLPDVEILGERKHYVSQLAIDNQTGEPLRVWCSYRSRDRHERGFNWVWHPGQHREESDFYIVAPAGETTLVEMLNQDEELEPISAIRARIWAEGEISGRVWDDDRWEDVWLVEQNPELDGERAYYAEDVDTYVYTIESSDEQLVFNQRLLRLVNSTPEPLSVSVRYQTFTDAGSWVWRELETELAPGQTTIPRDAHGTLLRAARAEISAESAHRRYLPENIWLVESSGNSRIYQAPQIGVFEYEFEARGEPTQRRTARVVNDGARIERRDEGVVREARVRDTYPILEEQGNWVLVALSEEEGDSGWIRRGDIAIDSEELQQPAPLNLGSLTVRVNQANIQAGTSVLSVVPRGTRLRILEERGGWYRVQVPEDDSRQGWIRASDVTVNAQ